MVKPVGPQVASVPGIFGATIMGDGSVVVILDVAPLVRRQVAHAARAVTEPRPPVEERARAAGHGGRRFGHDAQGHRPRAGTQQLRSGTAKDGIDALERMAERVPDLMLLDIEMPRMDGYELATAMKARSAPAQTCRSS